MKRALITGITGMDGSHLADLLLTKDYEVYGLERRSSGKSHTNIKHIEDKITLIPGDLTDQNSLMRALKVSDPAEIYNLAAQSFVGESWNTPEYTGNVTGLGVLRVLEAIREYGKSIKFYQASTSEMFGRMVENPANENTPFYPRSPYGVAKLYGHWITKNYRESYDMFNCSGILFNHETLSSNMPLIVKDKSGKIDILPIGDIVTLKSGVVFDLNKKEYQEGKPTKELFVWDKNGWTKVTWISGYPHIGDKNPRIINARNFLYTATGEHTCIMEDDNEVKTSDIKVGDKVKNVEYPEVEKTGDVSIEEAEFLGMLVGAGNLNRGAPRFTNKDLQLKKRFCSLWEHISTNGKCTYRKSYSGFTGDLVGQVDCSGNYSKDYDIYTKDCSVFGYKNKKVPKAILNGTKDIMEAFLVGYNACDGLKSNPCKYKFKNFKTNSATLASGLLFLISNVTGQKYNITVEESWAHGKQQFHYSINLLSDLSDNVGKYKEVLQKTKLGMSQREMYRVTGISRVFIRKVQNGYIPSNTHHLELCHNEVKKIVEIPNYEGWFFDLETESGTFCAGVGQGVVHNSPRRGHEFVTRKISDGVARIHLGLQEKIMLGNLDSYRDWGYAPAYVECMWLMLQQDAPDDYVVATGETHSIREFLDHAFKCVGIDDWSKYVGQDPRYMRPAEVDVLRGDSSKAREKLGWESSTTFEELVSKMVKNDIKLLS